MKKGKKRTVKQHARWEFVLYVADTTPRSIIATDNLRNLCRQYLKGNCRITVIDIVKEPGRALKNEILATPTLVRLLPGPPKTVIGTLANTEHVLNALEIRDDRDEIVSLLTSGTTRIGHA